MQHISFSSLDFIFNCMENRVFFLLLTQIFVFLNIFSFLSCICRMFSIKCLRCGDRVQPNDMVMRAQNYVFHLTCFVCCVCCQPLQKGEQFILRGGQLFCRHDFEKDLYLSQHHCPDDEYLMDEMRPRDGRRGPKRPRTILTSSQRRQFKASFEMSPKPCRKIREALAKDTGLSVRVVQVWFQNQRAKMKKIQRKSKQDGDKTSDKDSSKDDKGNATKNYCFKHKLNKSRRNGK